MKRAREFNIVLVTAPDVKTARVLARAVLTTRLAACVTLVPRVESHYWWQGKREQSPEVLMVLKTTQKCVAKLERLIVRKHPYDTPEFVTLRVEKGNARYLDWVKCSCTPTPN